MATSEWILTFDDGPLPADITEIGNRSDDELLQPLQDILDTLATHLAEPIPAVFFLRGPAYPWVPPAPDDLMAAGVKRIEDAGQKVALHCYRHDPDLWHGWPFTADEIRADLDEGLKYFSALTQEPLTAFRPPYGDGGLAAPEWANDNHRHFHRWDVDSEDWLHHPDGGILRQFVDDPDGHRRHILTTLPLKLMLPAFWPGPNDILMHVNLRTAANLPQIIDKISSTTRALGREPAYVVPEYYLSA